MALGKLSLSRLAQAALATANTLVKRDGNGVMFGANHASLGASGAAGAAIVADASGKVPTAALPAGNIVQQSSGSSFSSSANAYVDTGVSASITISANSKISMRCSSQWQGGAPVFALQVNGVDYDFAATMSNTYGNVAGERISPALAAGTYTVKLRVHPHGAAMTINSISNAVTVLTAEEIKA